MADQLPMIVGGVVVVLILAAVGFFLMQQKKDSSAGAAVAGAGGKGPVSVKVKLVWIEASEGPFDAAFDYQARKEVKNSKLRYHMQTIVEAWSKRKCGGVIVKHPSGRETQVIKFKDGQKVNGSPYLSIQFVSFTSDRRRTMLFLDNVKYEEIECEAETFELARKNINELKEGGRKTCPLSNLAYRETFIAPVQKI